MYWGEIAGLFTAFCWAGTSMFFSAAGKRIGSFSVNTIRLTIAVPLLGTTLLLSGSFQPGAWFDIGGVYLLALSGLVGLVAGDSALFRSFVILGPHKSTLLMSLVPIITALSAWFVLGEALSIPAWSGILITVCGVGYVVMLRNEGRFEVHGTDLRNGILFGIVGAVCQALGLVIAKAGMQSGIEPLAATFIRMTASLVTIWIIVAVGRKSTFVIKKIGDHRALWLTLGGAVCGPYLGVWMSLVSVSLIEAGVAATLMSTIPIWVIPLLWIVYRERTSRNAIIGTIAAIGGIALLFNR